MESNLISSNNPDEGFMSKLLWLFKGFIFPCFSPAFYEKAAKKRLIIAVVFLFIFAIIQSLISVVSASLSMRVFSEEIKRAYEQGTFPIISIKDGIASVKGIQPYVYSSKRDVIVIDTTGKVQEIDTKTFSRGILLTRTELHFVNEDGYRVVPLNDLHESFGNPIILDKDHVLKLWSTLILVIDLVVLVFGFLWNSVVRLGYIALIGLLVWGVVSLMRKGLGFSPILITGIYANVPALYLSFILKKVGVSFFSLNTILLVIIWAIALISVLMKENDTLKEVDSHISPI